MNWPIEDWEYPNDYMFAIERQKDIEASWQQWEQEQKRQPAIIKVVKPVKTDEIKCKPSTV